MIKHDEILISIAVTFKRKFEPRRTSDRNNRIKLTRDKTYVLFAASFCALGPLSWRKKEKNVSKPETNVIINRRNTNEHYFHDVCGSEVARISHVCIRMWVYVAVCTNESACACRYIVGDDVVVVVVVVVVPGCPVSSTSAFLSFFFLSFFFSISLTYTMFFLFFFPLVFLSLSLTLSLSFRYVYIYIYIYISFLFLVSLPYYIARSFSKSNFRRAVVFHSLGQNQSPLNRGAAEIPEPPRVAASIPPRLAPQPMPCPGA